MSRNKISNFHNIPPALAIILHEISRGPDWQSSRKRIRTMIQELRNISELFEKENISRDVSGAPYAGLDIHLHGAMDPLSGQGCAEPKCRVATAERLARSFGLIADRIWLTDHISTQILTMGRATNIVLDELMLSALVLRPLIPLVEVGIVRFRSPWMPQCDACFAEFEALVERTTREITPTFIRNFKKLKNPDGSYSFSADRCFEPPLLFWCPPSLSKLPSVREFAEDKISSEVRSAIWIAREAEMTAGSLFTNSRIGLSGLLACDGQVLKKKDLILFENDRQINIPWVSQLNAEQIVQLRQEASLALPTFRERLARALTSSVESRSESTIDLIGELREQAAEVRAELIAKSKNSARNWKVIYGLLSLTVSVYGISTNQIVPGLGGLLPLLQILINHKNGHGAEVDKLRTRPGYVLVKAQDILAHAD